MLFDREIVADELPEGGSYELVPPAWYDACISEAEVAPNKANTGEILKLKFTILGPAYEGRVVFCNLNIRNQSQKAEEIALQDLRAIMESIGLSRVKDSDQLIGGNCQIKVIKKAAEGDYQERNEIKGYKAIAGASMKQESPTKKKTPW